MTTRAETRNAVTQVTFCQTAGSYADEVVGCPTAVDHDHYDVVLDQHSKVLFRVWPVGTTWRTADGYTMRLRTYDTTFGDLIAADDSTEPGEVPKRPVFNGVAPSGGAFSDSGWLPGPDDVIVEYAPGEARPAPGSLFLRPNGEAWRLRDYRPNFAAEHNPFDKTTPSYVVGFPGGAMSTGDVLPDDARLVYAP